MLVIIGLIVLLVALAAAAFFWLRQPPSVPEPGAGEGEGTPAAPPEGTIEIVVAAQDIPRGKRITSDSVQPAAWPEASIPAEALTDVESALGRFARVDIVRGMPVVEGMLVEELADLGAVGSDAAVQIPEGKVAYALPVGRYSGVAWALQPGDHVDVIISFLLAELDEEFQTILPNFMTCVQPSEGEECQSGVMGRLEVLPNGWIVNLTPGETQRPRLLTQMTVQDATVLRVGDWPVEEEAPPAQAQPQEGEEVLVEEQAQQQAAPVIERASIEPLTLVVSPQDAMVLKYAQEAGADIDLVLRSANDSGQTVDTDTVTLQYIFDRYNMELPPRLPYGVTPPLNGLPLSAADEVGAASGGERVE
jgi:pilus assembly protein CpaB